MAARQHARTCVVCHLPLWGRERCSTRERGRGRRARFAGARARLDGAALELSGHDHGVDGLAHIRRAHVATIEDLAGVQIDVQVHH